MLAEQIVHDYLALAYAEPRPDRTAYDHLLLTAHRRIGTDPQVDSLANWTAQAAEEDNP